MNCEDLFGQILSGLCAILDSNAIVGIGTLALAFMTFMMLLESRSLRQQQLHPYVVVSLERTNLEGALAIEVKNCGSTPARNIKVNFPPAFPRLPILRPIQDGSLHQTLPLRTLEKGLDLLAPGQKRTLPILGGVEMEKACENLDIDRDCRTTVTYQDDYGIKYEEYHILDHRDTSWPLVHTAVL